MPTPQTPATADTREQQLWTEREHLLCEKDAIDIRLDEIRELIRKEQNKDT